MDATSASRCKKVVAYPATMDELLVDQFLDAYNTAPEQIILDVDATDDPLYGHQERRFFHGYYRHYRYLLLYIFCGEYLLSARLRQADQGGAAGTQEELARLIGIIREVLEFRQFHLRGLGPAQGEWNLVCMAWNLKRM